MELDTPPADALSAFVVINSYLKNTISEGHYVTGYVDGEDNLNAFLKDYDHVCATSYSIRTSFKKTSESASIDKHRYGTADRVYWKLSSGQPKIPFTGVPFIINSSVMKDCQYGPKYYKAKEKTVPISTSDDEVKSQKRPRFVQSKKKNCPAQVIIREIIAFDEFMLDVSKHKDSKACRQQKKTIMKQLRDKMEVGTVLAVRRYYVQVPLPEAHCSHPSVSELERKKRKRKSLNDPSKESNCGTDSANTDKQSRDMVNQTYLRTLLELNALPYTSVSEDNLAQATALLQDAISRLKSPQATYVDANSALNSAVEFNSTVNSNSKFVRKKQEKPTKINSDNHELQANQVPQIGNKISHDPSSLVDNHNLESLSLPTHDQSMQAGPGMLPDDNRHFHVMPVNAERHHMPDMNDHSHEIRQLPNFPSQSTLSSHPIQPLHNLSTPEVPAMYHATRTDMHPMSQQIYNGPMRMDLQHPWRRF